MIPLPLKALVLLALTATIFVAGWTANGWRRDSQERANDKAKFEATQESQRLARRAETANNERVIAALNASARRTATARRDADDAAAALVRVSGAAAQALGAAQVSHQACIDNANTLADVFGQCRGRLAEVGKAADGHSNDAQTLSEAWPTE
jgi:hypothetical protein